MESVRVCVCVYYLLLSAVWKVWFVAVISTGKALEWGLPFREPSYPFCASAEIQIQNEVCIHIRTFPLMLTSICFKDKVSLSKQMSYILLWLLHDPNSNPYILNWVNGQKPLSRHKGNWPSDRSTSSTVTPYKSEEGDALSLSRCPHSSHTLFLCWHIGQLNF